MGSESPLSSTQRRPPLLPLLLAALAVSAAFGYLLFGPGQPQRERPTTTTEPPIAAEEVAIATVDALAAAFNASNRGAFLGLLDADPTVLQWPDSLGGDDIPLLDPGWFAFERELASELALTGCSTRPPSTAGRDLYDTIVACDAALSDGLLTALDESTLSGRMEFGVTGGRIESVFWAETDRSAASAVRDLTLWMIANQPHLAAHWLGSTTDSRLYQGELATVLLNAVEERDRFGGGSPGSGGEIGPAPATRHHMTADPESGRVFLIVNRSNPLFPVPTPPELWELTPDDRWRELAGPHVALNAATLDYVTGRDDLVVLGATGPTNPSLVAVASSASDQPWQGRGTVSASEPGSGRIIIALSSALDTSADRIVAVAWPPAAWLYDVATNRWSDQADPWVARPETETPRPCWPEPVPQALSVAFDPLAATFIVAAGADLCRYDTATATIELIARGYGPADTRALAHDPIAGLLFILGDGALWTYDPASETIVERGPLPPDLLWRNASMTARAADSEMLVFDGAGLWAYHPADGSWNRRGTG